MTDSDVVYIIRRVCVHGHVAILEVEAANDAEYFAAGEDRI